MPGTIEFNYFINKDTSIDLCYDYRTDPRAMSEEQLKAFRKKIKNDSNLQAKIKATTDPSAIAEIAKQLGFLISPSDLVDGLGIDELDGIEWGAD
tara:strand:+ start:274 stop:558 length:285 start_codon:yes stop_codon:yes gene_type:complete